jgi:predicted O-methyltransferase YrrM
MISFFRKKKPESKVFKNINDKPFAFLGNSEFQHSIFIAELAKLSNCKKYLELGIYDASNINVISTVVEYTVGVDISKLFMIDKGFIFHEKTTDKFFEDNKEMFDIIFIDADHKYESVVRDFENSLNILNKNGIVLIHDTDPINDQYAEPGYCGDSYKINKYLEKEHPELTFTTLPFSESGLTIVNYRNNLRKDFK